MGFMTEISILNDRWHDIKRDIQKDPKKFTQLIDMLMNGQPRYSDIDGSYQGREIPGVGRLGLNSHFTMYPSHHADDAKLYLAWQNMFLSLSPYDLDDQYGGRLVSPDDHMLDVLERDVSHAKDILERAEQFLREKREQQEALRVARSL